MTILVDQLQEYPDLPHGHRRWCHMMTDDLGVDGIGELHAMALRLGLDPRWFTNHATLPHYDLVPSKRQLALQYGAVETTTVEMGRRCQRKKQ